jgi:alpha-D-xyloside xylohydrolase
MDFMADENVRNIGDEFMFGPSFLVAPVYEYGARGREIYLPACEGWYDFNTGKFIAGGQTMTVPAPYGRMPLYVRAGSIVPFGPQIQWSDEKPAEVIDLYVYRGADGSFTLYEDENVNYNYEKGLYSMIDFTYDDVAGVLTIGERRGEFPGMLRSRQFNIITVSQKGQSAPVVVKYDGTAVSVSL